MPPTSVILGTAGHIDHGKTALVKSLSGIDTDRLKEERRRGITIELGFAHLRLGDTLIGIVDVPGHERFIKSMVAGAGGIDLVMLVVAADEGVMPQTREHLDICQLLGVQRGLVALTKSDLVDKEWLELVADDLAQTLSGSFLKGAPIIPCSAHTSDGLDLLKTTLDQQCREVHPRDPRGLLRLPLDRVFTIKGFGTVVTGTLQSGSVSLGDDLAVLPTGVGGKVRGIEVHGDPVERAVAGQRTAINLGGVDRQQILRGEVLVRPGTLSPSHMMDAMVDLLPGTVRGFSRRTKVLFHLGTRQQEGACVLLDPIKLGPGGSALAQLRFETPVVALPGDRFILRGFRKQLNYGTTIGGGSVIRVLSRKARPRDRQIIELLGAMDRAEATERVALEVLAAGASGLTRSELQERIPLVPSALDKALQRLKELKHLVPFDRERGAVIHVQPFDELGSRALALVDAFHADTPLEQGLSKEELRSRLGRNLEPRLFHAVLSELSRKGDLVVEQHHCRRPNHQVKAAASALRPLASRIADMYRQAKLAPPKEAVVVQQTGEDPELVAAALKLLDQEGELEKLGVLYFATGALEQLKEKLVEFLQREESITPPQFKELVGQSRKFTIPLAEYFDARKVTLRIGDLRKLRG